MLKKHQDTTKHHSLTFRIRSQCIPSFQKVQETDYVEHTDMFVSCCSALSDWDTSRVTTMFIRVRGGGGGVCSPDDGALSLHHYLVAACLTRVRRQSCPGKNVY